jgi:cytochrome P450
MDGTQTGSGDGFLRRISRGMSSYVFKCKFLLLKKQDCIKEVAKIHQQKLKPSAADDKAFKTVFHEIMYSSELPPSEKSNHRMRCEAVQFVSTGTDTVSNTMHMLTFHVISQPAIFSRLRAEIRTVQPDPNSLAPLKRQEQLPYLTAVILEALRLGYGVST